MGSLQRLRWWSVDGQRGGRLSAGEDLFSDGHRLDCLRIFVGGLSEQLQAALPCLRPRQGSQRVQSVRSEIVRGSQSLECVERSNDTKARGFMESPAFFM